jgi:PiT family inorganic phosphate transporter
MEISPLVFALAIGLAFANGTNDVSKTIATLVGSGVTNYRSAIAWGTVWTVIGAGMAAFVASAMIKTYSHCLIQAGTVIEPTVTLAILIGAMAWILFASRTGFPVSTTHALTGAIVGTGLVGFAGEGLLWGAIGKKIALPLLLSPFLALTLSLLIHPAIRALAKKWDGACLCVMPASRALVAIDTNGSTRTLFQTASFSQPIIAVPSQCDRASYEAWLWDSIRFTGSPAAVVCPRHERCAEDRRHSLNQQLRHHMAQLLVAAYRFWWNRRCDGARQLLWWPPRNGNSC